ncbi:dCTP deaminase [Patescibacteria group bacterium]|nr:dCTP deaminase [Patescibacteria group bacterium]
MAVLSHDSIMRYIANGTLRIDPFDPRRVGPASIDLTLSKSFRVFKKVHDPVHLRNDAIDFDAVSELITVDRYYTLLPGQTVHGITRETLTLPATLCGWIQGRSRFARLGLMVHITASFIQPGVSNRQVLEMNNAGPFPIAIHPGVAICQIILEEMRGEARYRGLFRDQTAP